MLEKRGKEFGCGMSLTALGDGVIGIEPIYHALVKAGFDGYSTLEIAGEDAVLRSFDYLKKLGAS
jgi:inosose dehydratase